MQARDMMTADVISVTADRPIRQIAQLLLRAGISAVPVLDDDGAALGMVSEGDLIGRRDVAARDIREEWWLSLLAEGAAPGPDFPAGLGMLDRTARDVMSTPVITVGDETEFDEIARLLAAYRIKRVPVLHEGRVVGIVSRADLLRALVAERAARPARPASGFLADAFAQLDGHFHDRPVPVETSGAVSPQADAEDQSAGELQGLVDAFERKEAGEVATTRLAGREQRRQRTARMMDQHVSEAAWQSLLHKAHEAAEHGLTRLLLLQFPSEMCSDNGRAINLGEADWPSTLRAEAAETYLRWERDLKSRGFHLSASVVDFPDGMPGDVGMFLHWETLASRDAASPGQ